MSEEWTEADRAVEEVREIRRRLWAEFDDDPKKLIAYHVELDRRFQQRWADPRGRPEDLAEELLEIRRQLWDEFDNDPEKLAAHFIELQKQQSEESILAPRLGKKGKSAA